MTNDKKLSELQKKLENKASSLGRWTKGYAKAGVRIIRNPVVATIAAEKAAETKLGSKISQVGFSGQINGQQDA